MAIKDKLDDGFTNKLLKKALIGGVKSSQAAANDDVLLSQDSIVKISNSLTSLQNSFNKIYAYSSNLKTISQFENKRLQSIKRENTLESKIPTSISSAIAPSASAEPDISQTVGTLDALSESIDNLSSKIARSNASGGGSNGGPSAIALPLLLGLSKYGRKLIGPLGGAVDAFSRYSEGQSAGQIAAGVGGGLAGSALGAKAGAALGALGGPVAPITVPVGALIGGVGGYFAGGSLGDKAYESFERRAAGGPVRSGGTYVVGERGPEVITLNGAAGRVLSSNTKVSSRAEKELSDAAKKSLTAQAKLEKGKPISDTAYSSKLSNYLRDTLQNITSWVSRTGSFLSKLFGKKETGPAGGTLGTGEYAAVGDLSKVNAQWKNDKEFITAVNNVAAKYNIDANDLLGLMYHETGGTMSTSIDNGNGYVGLIQFGAAARKALGVSYEQLANMSRAQQMQYVDQYFAMNGLPSGANAGQLYANVFLPGIAKKQGYQGVITRSGEAFYNSNPSLDSNKDGQIDYFDLASVISGHREKLGLGKSPSLLTTDPSGGRFRIGSGSDSDFGQRINPVTGKKQFHGGVDIPAPKGVSVHAYRAGKVDQAGSMGSYGQVVFVTHTDGTQTRYAHLSSIAVPVGATVTEGQIIGRVGSTGRSTGNHLHFEFLNDKQQKVDPTGVYNNNPWIVGGDRTGAAITPPVIPRGFRKSGDTIVTPSRYGIPLSAVRPGDVPNYGNLPRSAQKEIELYFRMQK